MHVFLDDFEICNLPNSGRRHEKSFFIRENYTTSIPLLLSRHMVSCNMEAIFSMPSSQNGFFKRRRLKCAHFLISLCTVLKLAADSTASLIFLGVIVELEASRKIVLLPLAVVAV
jgi:hypothetical protein